MEKYGRAQPVRRFEDRRFLTGEGRYIDDVAPADALFAVFVRSQVAHGRLAPLDLSDIRDMPGVRLAAAAEDLPALGVTGLIRGVVQTNRDGTKGVDASRPVLASGKVRHVGEPLAVVVADTLDAARDAADAVLPEIEELPVKLDLAPGGEPIHDAAPDNVALDWGIGDHEATARAIEAAAHVVKTRVVDNRVMAASLEPRGCVASWDGARLHFTFGGQGVWNTKSRLARLLGLPKDAVHVTIPDVGGGFGMKGMDYSEYFAVAAAARALSRPVRWTADRIEAMLSDNGGRDLVTDTVVAFDADLRLVAYRADTVFNLGAWNSQFGQNMQTTLFSKVASGAYDVRDVALTAKAVYTNTTQVDAYRGAGRPEAIYALERSMDNAARILGLAPWDLRRRSFIPPEKFPYKTAIAETYDVGDFDRVLSRALEKADVEGFEARRRADAAEGRLRGFGLGFYIESILGDQDEAAEIVFTPSGRIELLVGTQSNGQGHETVLPKLLADRSGIDVALIDFVQGDSDRIGKGGGTGGSRSVTMQGTAILATIGTAVAALEAFLKERAGTDDVVFDGERFRIGGSNETPGLPEVAAMAREAGREDLTRFRESIHMENRSFPYGAHIAEVSIDEDTGRVELRRYTVVDDFGTLINPLLVEGQVHGGVAQGVGQALTERVVHGPDGQLLTASFMDYAMPRAYDLPMISFSTEPVPSLYNPMGMKGCGEAGTVGALPAVANAVADALWERGMRDVQMPFTPERVWRMLNEAHVAH